MGQLGEHFRHSKNRRAFSGAGATSLGDEEIDKLVREREQVRFCVPSFHVHDQQPFVSWEP